MALCGRCSLGITVLVVYVSPAIHLVHLAYFLRAAASISIYQPPLSTIFSTPKITRGRSMQSRPSLTTKHFPSLVLAGGVCVCVSGSQECARGATSMQGRKWAEKVDSAGGTGREEHAGWRRVCARRRNMQGGACRQDMREGGAPPPLRESFCAV